MIKDYLMFQIDSASAQAFLVIALIKGIEGILRKTDVVANIIPPPK